MKRICVDARMYLASGIGTYLRHLLTSLVKEGTYEVRLIADRKILDRAPDLKNYDLVVSNAPIYSLREQAELPMKVPACDIFWSPNFNVPLLPIRAKKRLVTLHDVFYLAHSNTLPIHKKYYARVVTKRAAQGADVVITDSEFSRGEICKYTGIANDKIEKILLGVDPDVFSDGMQENEASEIVIKYSPPQRFILYVGNIKPHKNIKRLLEAYKIFSKLHPDVHLILIGKHFSDFAIRSQVESDTELRRLVHFYTSVQNAELKWFYSHALVTMLPSLYEGFGLTPLEAMCCGCPTIVSSAASLPEVCGDASYYIDPLSTESIAEGLSKVVKDESLRKDLSEKGYQRVKMFDWQKAFEQHLQVFDRLLSKG